MASGKNPYASLKPCPEEDCPVVIGMVLSVENVGPLDVCGPSRPDGPDDVKRIEAEACVSMVPNLIRSQRFFRLAVTDWGGNLESLLPELSAGLLMLPKTNRGVDCWEVCVDGAAIDLAGAVRLFCALSKINRGVDCWLLCTVGGSDVVAVVLRLFCVSARLFMLSKTNKGVDCCEFSLFCVAGGAKDVAGVLLLLCDTGFIKSPRSGTKFTAVFDGGGDFGLLCLAFSEVCLLPPNTNTQVEGWEPLWADVGWDAGGVFGILCAPNFIKSPKEGIRFCAAVCRACGWACEALIATSPGPSMFHVPKLKPLRFACWMLCSASIADGCDSGVFLPVPA